LLQPQITNYTVHVLCFFYFEYFLGRSVLEQPFCLAWEAMGCGARHMMARRDMSRDDGLLPVSVRTDIYGYFVFIIRIVNGAADMADHSHMPY
jgi:hypothetical protein